MRNWISFTPGGDRERFEKKLYRLATRYGHAAVLTDKYPFYNGSAGQFHEFDLLAGFDALDILEDDLEVLETKAPCFNDWLLGYFSYDLKNQLEPGSFKRMVNDSFQFDQMCFFRPRYLVKNEGHTWHVGYDSVVDTSCSARQFVREIQGVDISSCEEMNSKPDFKSGLSRDQYLQVVEKLKKHIQRGDIYEVNFCFDFFSEGTPIVPEHTFERLMEVSPMPFSVFLKRKDSFVMGASPERYLRSRGARIVSQPMKGTSKRTGCSKDDMHSFRELSDSEKERAENIMITDLVRNDLSRIAARGTVKVDELCGIFPYPGVYQMVSTVSAQLHPDAGWLDPVKSSFPMGSMTGAPKIKAMQLIDRYEKGPRGLYSGAVGYITPQMDFDFNVVIRSLLYNKSTRYLSYSVGSAITDSCLPEKEYQECLLKAAAWDRVFGINK